MQIRCKREGFHGTSLRKGFERAERQAAVDGQPGGAGRAPGASRRAGLDEQLAKRVLDEEDAINELQLEIDDRVVQLLALHQLMAADLRFVLAVSRINNDLERIGDQAVNIAQGALRILRHPRVKPYVDLPRMTELVEEQVRNALNAVVRRDVELAQKVMASDDQVDHYRDQIFRELLTYMMGDSSLVFPAFELILVAKNLERIGDHATNIAEDVIYIVQGQDIRHPSIDRR